MQSKQPGDHAGDDHIEKNNFRGLSGAVELGDDDRHLARKTEWTEFSLVKEIVKTTQV